MNRHVVMILRNTNIPQYWRTHSPRHKWLDLLGITTSMVHLPPRRSFIFFFASFPKSIFVILKLKTVNEYVWLFSSEVGLNDDGSSFLVVDFAFAFVRFAYFAFLIWVLSGLVCNLHIDDQTLTKMNSRKTKHFYLPTLALGSADWEHTKRPPPPLIQWGPYTLDSHQL